MEKLSILKDGEKLIKAKGAQYIIRRKDGSVRVCTHNKECSLTDQSWKKDCDVNHIVNKYMKTGQLTHVAKGEGQYLDVSEISDLQDGLLKIKQAEELFRQLPEKVRQVCKTPRELVTYLADPKNDDQAVELGLKTKVVLADKVVDQGASHEESKSESKKDSAKKE
jgi:dTDP-glucose pyrophosphorylase